MFGVCVDPLLRGLAGQAQLPALLRKPAAGVEIPGLTTELAGRAVTCSRPRSASACSPFIWRVVLSLVRWGRGGPGASDYHCAHRLTF